MYYSNEFAFDNCCEEYKLHSQDEKVNREEYLPQELLHLSYDLHDEVLSHKHKLEMNYKGFECFPTIIKYDCGESEVLISLTTRGNDQLSTGQMTIEINQASSQFPDLQIKGSCSNHEEPYFQGLSNLQLEHQEDIPSPYEYVASNYDKELGNIFPGLFQNFIVDTPIFDQYSDEEEDVKICEDPWFTQISSSSSF